MSFTAPVIPITDSATGGTININAADITITFTSSTTNYLYAYYNSPAPIRYTVGELPDDIATAAQNLIAVTESASGRTFYINPLKIDALNSDGGTGSKIYNQFMGQSSPVIMVVDESPAAIRAEIATLQGTETVTSIIAHAGGGQANATALNPGYNIIKTVATAGDSVILPAVSEGLVVTVKNETATNAAAIFPQSGESIDDLAADASISIAPGETIVFTGAETTSLKWETSIQAIAAENGAVGTPSFTFVTDPDTGLYRIGANNIGVAANGAKVLDISPTGLGVTGSAFGASSTFAPFVPVVAQQNLSGAGAINVTSYYTAWTTTAANAGTLANGVQVGQLKKITLVVDGGDGTLTPTSLSGGTTITFNDAGDFVLLVWNGTAWVVLENSGTTVA
jgi:hypothetical protein